MNNLDVKHWEQAKGQGRGRHRRGIRGVGVLVGLVCPDDLEKQKNLVQKPVHFSEMLS